MFPTKSITDWAASPVAMPTFAYPSSAAAPLLAGVAEVEADALSDLDALFQALFGKLRIAVIYSGDKEQPGSVLYRQANTRPWKSYREVAVDIQQTLREIGFQHVCLLPDDMNMIDALRRESIHLAWLNTGGVQGENPVCHAAAILEMLGIPYVGHNPLTASILDEKDVFKRHLQSMGIRTSPFVTWLPANARSLSWRMEKAFDGHRGPFVVKPVSGRASLHVHHVERFEDVAARAEEVYAVTRKGVLIEKYLGGREFCVAVCGGVTRRRGCFHQSAQPFAFSTLERHFEAGERIFTSMDRKAISADRASLLTSREASLRFELMDLARQIYREFDLRSIVRVDIRADDQGQLHVLEANPKPDLKRPAEGRTSLVSMGLSEYGMDYRDLIFGLLADRVNDLLTCNPSKIEHILSLVSA
jgi:D-alanine-D-alanine ligase